MTLQLSKYAVELKDELSWWDEEELKSVVAGAFRFGGGGKPEAMDAEKYTEAKLKVLKLFIVSIKEGDRVIPFSIGWLQGLSRDDGKKLADAVSLDSFASLAKK